MHASFKKWLLAEPRIRSVRFQYGFLAFIIGFIIFEAVVAASLSPSYRLGRLFGFIVPFMFLFNHLAYQFRWSQKVTIILRVVAWVWIVFGLSYMMFVICKL